MPGILLSRTRIRRALCKRVSSHHRHRRCTASVAAARERYKTAPDKRSEPLKACEHASTGSTCVYQTATRTSRLGWRSIDADQVLRKVCLQRLLGVFVGKLQPSSGISVAPLLPTIAKLEQALYMKANSREEYSCWATLSSRVEELVRRSV